MSTIEFKDLNKSIGTELFADTESFLEDLGDDAADVVGGASNAQTTLYGPTTGYTPDNHHDVVNFLPHLIRPVHPIRPIRYPDLTHVTFNNG